MKRIEDILQTTCIKCENKTTSDKLKQLHYQINDVLFKYKKRYAFKYYVDNLYKELLPLFKELKDLDVPQTSIPKKEEILSIGRYIFKILKNYTEDNSNIESAIENSLKYEMSNFVKTKANLYKLPIQNYIDLLTANKTLFDCLIPYKTIIDNNPNLKSKFENHIKLQKQLIELTYNFITNKYLL